MEDKIQNLFGGLWLLLSGLNFESILSTFRTTSLHKESNIEGFGSKDTISQAYDYNSELDIRIMDEEDIEGTYYPVYLDKPV